MKFLFDEFCLACLVEGVSNDKRGATLREAIAMIERRWPKMGAHPQSNVAIPVWALEKVLVSTKRVWKLLEENGCDCPCEHHAGDHDDECERCLACLIDKEMWSE